MSVLCANITFKNSCKFVIGSVLCPGNKDAATEEWIQLWLYAERAVALLTSPAIESPDTIQTVVWLWCDGEGGRGSQVM